MHGFKLADLKTELLPHQARAVERLKQEDQPGLIAYHGLGSGKTLTSIAAQDALKMPATVVAPAALQANYEKERARHLSGRKQPIELETLQAVARHGAPASNPLLILDEGHRIRDPHSASYQAMSHNDAEKRLLLTGSPFYNHPADVAPLINFVAGAPVLPHDRAKFEQAYIAEKIVTPGLWDRLVNKATPGAVQVLRPDKAKELEGVFSKWIDRYPGSTENFPTIERRDVEVPMTPEQMEHYEAQLGRAPPWVAAKVRRGLPPTKQESKDLNAFLGAIRQISNTTAPFVTDGQAHDPKIESAFQALKKELESNPRAKGVVYSNFLTAGIDPYKKRLQGAGIPYGEFTGEMKQHERDALVQQYNEGKLRALLLSSAGGEGLDLKGTRLLQILDPHWNAEKIKQVEGRGARYKSHEGLPEEERKIRIERYLATRPQSIVDRIKSVAGRKPDQSVDQYLQMLSQQKEDLLDQFRGLIPVPPPPAPAAPAAPPVGEKLASGILALAPRLG
jgi:SNF2 family DNA or RNA helicase